jgi:hypothetical protein
MKRYQLIGMVLAFGLVVFVVCDVLQPKEFEPTGSTFNLNSSIRVISITGNVNFSPNGPLTLGMTIASKSSSIETDVLPAGLLFKRRKNDMQHMLLLKRHAVTTGTGNKTELLGCFCCNEHRPSPDEGDTFDIGPITDDAGLLQIANLVRDKDISRGQDMWMVQHAVYLVTDSTGITQAYVDSINALPQVPGLARH